jgi:hypothetical protein
MVNVLFKPRERETKAWWLSHCHCAVGSAWAKLNQPSFGKRNALLELTKKKVHSSLLFKCGDDFFFFLFGYYLAYCVSWQIGY